jgi:sec-independent protein translocase protein TatC
MLRRAVGHQDDLTTVGHLDELRSRIIASLLVLAAAFAVCFWQNHLLLGLINRPLARQTQAQVRAGDGPLGATYVVAQSARDVAVQLREIAGPAHAAALDRDIQRLSQPPHGDRPVTLGIGEPLATTATVSLVFALILALPYILLQAYAFLMPAVEPQQRRALRPLLAAVPALFVAGVTFGYLVVLPAAVHFLQNFNGSQFNVLVQASQYYRFAATTLLAMGLLFEIPIAILAATRAGIVTPQQLRRNRRYAVLACGAIAALLPGDAVTMLLETVPPYLLFELGVLLAAVAERRRPVIHTAPAPVSH